MDFSLPPGLKLLQDEVKTFIAEQIIPLEKDARQTAHGPTEGFREELVGLARKAGLLTPHASQELGGRGWTHIEKAIAFEEAGYST